jgi:hypothetical protein
VTTQRHAAAGCLFERALLGSFASGSPALALTGELSREVRGLPIVKGPRHTAPARLFERALVGSFVSGLLGLAIIGELPPKVQECRL